jgi:hypothetical protein
MGILKNLTFNAQKLTWCPGVLAEKAKKIMTAPTILMPSLNARRLERYPWLYIYKYIVEASHSRAHEDRASTSLPQSMAGL